MFGEKDFNEAPTGYGRNYLPPGVDDDVTIVKIGEVLPKDSFRGEHSFFVEMTWRGTPYSWVQKIPEKDGVQKERTRALATIKGFLAAALGPDEFEKANHAEVYRLATSAANPFAGTRVHVRTTEKTTKAGKPWTRHDWSPVVAG